MFQSLHLELKDNSLRSPSETISAINAISDYEEFSALQKEKNPTAFAEALYKVLSNLERDTPVWNLGLRALSELSGYIGQPPSPLVLSKGLRREGAIAVSCGTYADIWSGSYNGERVAIKSLRVYDDEDVEKLVQHLSKECVVWKFLEHPSILPFLGVSTNTGVSLVSPWMPHGNISTYLKNQPDVNRVTLLHQVAQGLEFLHSKQLVHGDMKGRNILIDKAGHARIADYGLVTITSDPQSPIVSGEGNPRGSCRWTSPELMDPCHKNSTETPTAACDVFAFGMVAFEIFAGDVPFHLHNNEQVISMVIAGERPNRPTEGYKFGLTDNIWSIIESCWDQDPTKRPDMRTVWSSLAKEFESTAGSQLKGGDTDIAKADPNREFEDPNSSLAVKGTKFSGMLWFFKILASGCIIQ